MLLQKIILFLQIKLKNTELSECGNNFTEYYFFIGKRQTKKGTEVFELLKATKI